MRMLILLPLLLAAPALAQPRPEAPRSGRKMLRPGEKIRDLYQRNLRDPYVLQQLTRRAWWVQHAHYSATFYVGDQGVLVFDPFLDGAPHILKAIREVTLLPVTAIVYSHDHADHIGDAAVMIEAAERAGVRPRIIANRETVAKQQYLRSKLPRVTELIAWPRGSFTFEGLTVQFHGFERAAHTDDHGAWLLQEERVLHVPDLVNPGELPFWELAGAEAPVYYEANLRALEVLEWTHLNGGHGNVGSKEDLAFYFTYLADLRNAVGRAMEETKYAEGIDPHKQRHHAILLTSYFDNIGKRATEVLRAKYGRYPGFDVVAPSHAMAIARTMFLYQ